MSSYAQYIPVAGFALFFAVGFLWRSWLQYKRYGTTGIILFRTARHDQLVRDGLFLLFILVEAVQALVAAVRPEWLEREAFAALPLSGPWFILGACLLFGGTAFMVAAQLYLGKSWRIGIDESASPGLVTGGLYRLCRNPIFLGMFISLAGLTVLLPTAISAMVLVGAWLCVRSQVREEEAYLLRTYGDDYREFASRIGRFIPLAGTLR